MPAEAGETRVAKPMPDEMGGSNAAGRPERDQRVAGRKNHTLHGENGAL